jgi:hypothetical protein
VVVPIEREAELIEVDFNRNIIGTSLHRLLLRVKAYGASAQAAEEKERRKKEERVVRLWTKIIQGLRIRDRLKSQYAEGTTKVLLLNADVSDTIRIFPSTATFADGLSSRT